jgi:hypothetical protein
MSSMRIVLVDPLGDVLFSGESWLTAGYSAAANHDGTESEAETETETESECPETLRSGSGIFPVDRPKHGTATGSSTADEDDERDERAA